MPGAYQTSGFAYQGAGQFAYQESAGPPKAFGRHPPRGLSRRQLSELEDKWLDRKWLRHPTIEVPPTEHEAPIVYPAIYEAFGVTILGLGSDGEASATLRAEVDTVIGVRVAHDVGVELEPQGMDHELRLEASGDASSDTTHTGSPRLGFTDRSDVTKDLYLEREFTTEEIEALLARLPKEPKA